MEKTPSVSEIYPREEVILEEFKTGGGTKAILFNILFNWLKVLTPSQIVMAK